MKIQFNKNIEEGQLVIRDYSWIVKLVLVIFIVILNFCIANSQNASGRLRPGLGTEFVSSGNGHGGFTVPYMALISKRNSVMAGFMIHNSSGQLKGLKVTYSRNLSGNYNIVSYEDYVRVQPEVFQLNFVSYFEYIDPTTLCSCLARREQLIHRDNSINYKEVMISTIETGAGIEFRININSSVSIRNFIGAGFYYHPDYTVPMDHERCSSTLQLGTGIHFKI